MIYVVTFVLPDGYEFGRYATRSRKLAERKMLMNPEWDFMLVEVSNNRMVWSGK